MHKLMQTFRRAERGTTSIEYVLIASLVSTFIVGAVTALGNGVSTTLYNNIAKLF